MTQGNNVDLTGNFINQLEIQPQLIDAWLGKHLGQGIASAKQVIDDSGEKTMICMAQWG